MKYTLILLMIFITLSCENKNRNYEDDSSFDTTYSENGYSDGTYCAEIEYYYSKTGTRSTCLCMISLRV